MSDAHRPYDEPPSEEQFDARRDAGGPWPAPTVEEPSDDEIEYQLMEGVGEAIDGCGNIENDGHCEHFMPAWAIYLGHI